MQMLQVLTRSREDYLSIEKLYRNNGRLKKAFMMEVELRID